MTSAQVTALTHGLLGFVVVWGVVLVPQLIGHYARFGRVHGRRIAGTAVVTLYTCLAVAVVLLPLPDPDSPRLTQTVQLVPLQWVADIGTELDRHGLSASQALFTLTFQQLAMNVLLFLPLGMFGRLLWRRGLGGTVAFGFGTSLGIEITQITANFGTAPYVYRIFDIDDLLANTAGAALGWVAAALFVTLLGTRRLTPAAAATAAPAPSPTTVSSRTTRPLPTGPVVHASGGRGGALPVDPRTPPWPPRR